MTHRPGTGSHKARGFATEEQTGSRAPGQYASPAPLPLRHLPTRITFS